MADTATAYEKRDGPDTTRSAPRLLRKKPKPLDRRSWRRRQRSTYPCTCASTVSSTLSCAARPPRSRCRPQPLSVACCDRPSKSPVSRSTLPTWRASLAGSRARSYTAHKSQGHRRGRACAWQRVARTSAHPGQRPQAPSWPLSFTYVRRWMSADTAWRPWPAGTGAAGCMNRRRCRPGVQQRSPTIIPASRL